MVQKMNRVAADFRRASNKQMAETTKRTINENARIEQTVDEMDDVTIRVNNENEQILDAVCFEKTLIHFALFYIYVFFLFQES